MRSRFFLLTLAGVFLCVVPLFGQAHHPRHSRYPNSPLNDPQLLLPVDQGQFCYTPESALRGSDQFQQFDTFPQPASKGYLCINIPPGRTFVIDHLFAEADYDQELPAGAEWYLDAVIGNYEQTTGFAAARAGS
jgi:hypothetical protein